MFASARRMFASRAGASASLWQRYNGLLVSHPFTTKCATGGIIAVTADLVCQTTFPTDEVKHLSLWDRINWRRTMNFALVNTFFFPPIAHYWYGFLSVKIVGDTFAAALKRVALDQAFFGPVCLTGFFSLNLLLEGNAHKIVDKLSNDLMPTMVANYAVWIPAQLINFKFVPIPSRVLFVNMVGFFWNIYLSNAANTSSVKIAPSPEAPADKTDA